MHSCARSVHSCCTRIIELYFTKTCFCVVILIDRADEFFVIVMGMTVIMCALGRLVCLLNKLTNESSFITVFRSIWMNVHWPAQYGQCADATCVDSCK